MAACKSFSAPVLISAKTTSSAARPPNCPLSLSSRAEPVHEIAILGGKLHGVTQGRVAVWDNGNFMHRVGVLAESGHQRMADFMIGHAAFLLFAEAPALSLRAGHDFVHGIVQILLSGFLAMPAGGQQSRFVDQVRQVRA